MRTLLKLQPLNVLHLPLNNYQQDFTFIINDKKILTSRIVADLLSPKISRFHQTDPTITEYSINTTNQGDFNAILNLVTFEESKIKEDDLLFFSEIFEKLEIQREHIKVSNLFRGQKSPIEDLTIHLKFPVIFSSEVDDDIEFISEHFFELDDEDKFKIEKFPIEIIERIIGNPKLKLESEDQLIEIVNELYSIDSKNSFLYEYVMFTNISMSQMKKFVSNIIIDDITRDVWLSISSRLCEELESSVKTAGRYKKKKSDRIKLLYSGKQSEFDGIISHLRKQSGIENEVRISCSANDYGDPMSLLEYENKDTYFNTKNQPNSWICFEFLNHEIIPTNYTIRTFNFGSGNHHMKNWILEGSNDNSSWTKLDEQKNCQFLNGTSYVYTFRVQNKMQKSFKYLRITQTGPNWHNQNLLSFNSIEFYGQLI